MTAWPERARLRWILWVDSSPGDRMLFFRAALFLLLTRGALKTIGFASIRRLLDASPAGEETGRVEEARQVARSVERAGRYLPFATNCLDRALALCWILRLDLLGGALHIGVKRHDDGLAAHAWVERMGERLLDDGGGEFDSFDVALLGGNR